MKSIAIVVLGVMFMSFIKWQPDFQTAQNLAKEKHQLILLNFSGSDWCGPCMRMRKEIFENEVFTAYSDTALELVNADFPRNKKNQLSPEITKANEALADQYNKVGAFPFTVLLDADGKILRSWPGLPKEDAAAFVKEIKAVYDAKQR